MEQDAFVATTGAAQGRPHHLAGSKPQFRRFAVIHCVASVDGLMQARNAGTRPEGEEQQLRTPGSAGWSFERFEQTARLVAAVATVGAVGEGAQGRAGFGAAAQVVEGERTIVAGLGDQAAMASGSEVAIPAGERRSVVVLDEVSLVRLSV